LTSRFPVNTSPWSVTLCFDLTCSSIGSESVSFRLLEYVYIPLSENKYHLHLKKSRQNLLVSSGYR
jgi:hypothetical protein